MIPDNMFEIRLLKRPHKFFVYWIGRPDSHIMDWAGCNFHWVKAEGQPKGGFDNPWDAWLWADKRIVLQKQEVQDELAGKSGTHKSDYKEYFITSLSFRWGYAEFRVKCPLFCDEHDQEYFDPPEEWVKDYKKWLDERRLIWAKTSKWHGGRKRNGE